MSLSEKYPVCHAPSLLGRANLSGLKSRELAQEQRVESKVAAHLVGSPTAIPRFPKVGSD